MGYRLLVSRKRLSFSNKTQNYKFMEYSGAQASAWATCCLTRAPSSYAKDYTQFFLFPSGQLIQQYNSCFVQSLRLSLLCVVWIQHDIDTDASTGYEFKYRILNFDILICCMFGLCEKCNTSEKYSSVIMMENDGVPSDLIPTNCYTRKYTTDTFKHIHAMHTIM